MADPLVTINIISSSAMVFGVVAGWLVVDGWESDICLELCQTRRFMIRNDTNLLLKPFPVMIATDRGQTAAAGLVPSNAAAVLYYANGSRVESR